MNHERLADLDLKPVVVFVNTRSGGQQGMKVLTVAWSEKMYAGCRSGALDDFCH